MPQSVEKARGYQRMTDAGEDSGQYISPWNTGLPRDPRAYQGLGANFIRRLGPKVDGSQTLAVSADQDETLGYPREIPEVHIERHVAIPIIPECTQHVFDMGMTSAPKRKRRTFSDTEKKRIKHVRKYGACLECKNKKRACKHVRDQPDDHPSPQTPESENEPATPDSDTVSSLAYSTQKNIPQEFSYEDYLNDDVL
ncbi:MAG: hypothetical protein Q9170_006235 [Blastenia crenularia]